MDFDERKSLTMNDTPSEELSDTTQLTTAKQKPKKLPTECKICGVPALYSSFGAVVCSSCKVFFRRNAQRKKVRFTYEDISFIYINLF